MGSVARWKHALPFVPCLLGACRVDATVEADDSAFSVMDPARGASILPEIENSHGSPSVCVGLLGFEAKAREEATARIETLVTDAATKWNALLHGDAEWSLQDSNVVPKFHVQGTECPRTGPGFNVNVWATAEQFKDEYCSRPNYTCSSGAIAAYRTLYLGPWNRTEAADVFDPFVVLHEYGHLLGLGDTYLRPGVTEWVGEQPASVMNGKSHVLTEDDKLGLWVTVRALKSGRRSCDGFGDDVVVAVNSTNVLMCAPDAEPKNDHDEPVPNANPVLPTEGMWAYEGYALESTAMRIRGVTRDGAGFRMSVTGYSNGAPTGSGTLYRCSANGSCAAATDPDYRILVASATSLRLIYPDIPAGIQADFARP